MSETAQHGGLDLVWGAAAIADEIKLNQRQTFYLLEQKKLPAKKIGNRWCADRTALRQFFNVEAA